MKERTKIGGLLRVRHPEYETGKAVSLTGRLTIMEEEGIPGRDQDVISDKDQESGYIIKRI